MKKRLAVICLACLAILSSASTVWACSVCQGNRDSHLVKGAESGVLALVLITYGVLFSFAGFATVWLVRSRRLSNQFKGKSSA